MKISLNWIKEFVDLNGIDEKELLNQFTLSVAEIEEVQFLGKDISNVVTARIESVAPHPNSNKLSLITVNDGKQIYEVVCGAPNLQVGMVVPYAKVGGMVGGQKIGVATIAGATSHGMCCSEKELGLSDSGEGLMQFEKDMQLGLDLKSFLPIEDVVFEVDNKSLTNRPDLWGHYGIAREMAALTKRKLLPLSVNKNIKNDKLPNVNVTVNSEHCYRYSAITAKNITKCVSPKAMQVRLHYTGHRAINLLTDLTNYVMTELGQPMHAFDNSIVKSIEVFDLSKDTEFTTLDEQVRVLPKNTMVIAQNGQPVAVAGVMGGLESGISDTTTSLLLESANFDATTVRKTATAIGLRSESSSRFEKTLDPELTEVAIKRFLKLLQDIDGGAELTSNFTDIYNKKYPVVSFDITKKYIDGYIGQELAEQEIIGILESLEFVVKNNGGGNYHITVPAHRATKDVALPCDIVEEVTRIYGYDNIIPTPTEQPVVPVQNNAFNERQALVKTVLATKFALSEVHSTLWYDSESNAELGINPNSVVSLVNALQKENSSIRQTIVPSLLKFVNENKKDFKEFGLFEIGKVASDLDPKTNLVLQNSKLGIAKYSQTKTYEQLLFEVKGAVEYLVEYLLNQKLTVSAKVATTDYYHPVNNYEFYVNDQLLGEIAVLHPSVTSKMHKKAQVVVAELDFDVFAKLEQKVAQYEKKTKYPVTDYDFTFNTNKNTLYADLLNVANQVKTNLQYHTRFVGAYSNEEYGVNTHTIRIRVWSNNKTLTSEELDEFYNNVVDTFKKHNFLLS